MKAEIITIGDEILIGQTVDTNSAWMAQVLNALGVEIHHIATVSDNKESIEKALDLALNRANLILLTGGLGPTKDDITKDALCSYFQTDLVYNSDVYDNVLELFAKIGKEPTVLNKDQAMVPANCKVLLNKKGTAPGMLFHRNDTIVVCMPGVPYEMKYLMEYEVIPYIQPFLDSYEIVHRTITVVDIPESQLALQIEDIESQLPPHIKLAYLPHLNLVKLRLSGKSAQLEREVLTDEVENHLQRIKERIGNVWFEGSTNVAEIVGRLLSKEKKTLGTVESCTGGYIAHQITAIPGSSEYYLGSLITYAYDHKIEHASVDSKVLWEKGAVSEEVAYQMALNGKKKLNVDFCLSTTGIAGPSGATESKSVGLVYIGLAKPNGEVEIRQCRFRGTRLQVIERTAYTALEMVRKTLLEESK